MSFCGEHGTSDGCPECMMEDADKRIAELETENARLRKAAEDMVETLQAILDDVTVTNVYGVYCKDSDVSAWRNVVLGGTADKGE